MTIGAGIQLGMIGTPNGNGEDVAVGGPAGVSRQIESFQEQRDEAWMLDISEQFTVSSGGFGYVVLGTPTGPPAGYYWVVRFLSVSDSTTWTAAATGSGQFGKAATQPINPNTPQPPVTVRNPFTAMPFSILQK